MQMVAQSDTVGTHTKCCGMQVAPAELEDILRSHPGIADAAVIGIPSDRSGEVPKAFVVPREPKLTEDDVKKFVAEKVSEHKHLAGGVQFITTVPKTASGKILRRNLKEMYSK
jgi:acyl-coenzyme A synthetase/AMP-(fatty) acid ligase